uniref:Ferritin n=1 Tax=Liolophura japonica TaxID=13599 RepID=O15972_LIOJA|nr:ferritin subunit [Liolophura japonica]
MKVLLVLAFVGLAFVAAEDKRLTCTAFSDSLIEKMNDQINLELHASYLYHGYARYFDRDDVALSGFADFFKHASSEEKDHADKLMEYMNTRGCRFLLKDITYKDVCDKINEKKPAELSSACICEFTAAATGGDPSSCSANRPEWFNGKQAMENALTIEHHVNDELLKLHRSTNDPHFEKFLEDNYLDEQVNAIKELSDYITILKRTGDGLGEYLFDKDLDSKY